MSAFPAPYLVISSAHDYRSKKRANIHFITDALASRGETMFLSTHSSALSRLKGRDTRHQQFSDMGLTANGVSCYLWHSLLHPVNVASAAGRWWNPVASAVYRRRMPPIVRAMIRKAATIVVESGSAVALLSEIRWLNPEAKIIYNASDTLGTIGLGRYYDDQLAAAAAGIAYARLPSALMIPDHRSIAEHRVIAHGLDDAFFTGGLPDPYEGKRAAISVGSMLFDPHVFDVAAQAFPDLQFTVIGSGHQGTDRANLRWLPEMPFRDTIPYIRHATLGIAPYRSALASDYLIDTSMKLLQFEAAGLPAVCPDFVQGGKPTRHGYRVGDAASIVAAMRAALDAPKAALAPPRTWDRVVDEMLAPSPLSAGGAPVTGASA
ncbi:hypothetical protein WBP07_11295 [Novosphingobium sp. BL-8A]|uniref:GumK N-terminal domain-containing glycosyltransferase n=1 Tax=Novosphingobium sp. BL-8A TaxID=3127639 RepID=UPI0037584526